MGLQLSDPPRYLGRSNHMILGVADDLEQFLFEASRQSLASLAVGLRKVDGNNCFYCGAPLNKVDVDHFIPFSLYPRDLAHNFLLAHPFTPCHVNRG